MTTTPRHALPAASTMRAAFLGRDASFDGVFWAGVKTTGVFCRPGCPARSPRPEHLEFFATTARALDAGYRPCRRCRPLASAGTPPRWLEPLLEAVESDPSRRWTAADLRAHGLSPERVRRWFKRHHGVSFAEYSRARRLGSALRDLSNGGAVSRAAFDAGYESLSGFQEAFRQHFGAPPTDLDGAAVIEVDRIETELGSVVAAATTTALCLLEFSDRTALPRQISRIRGGMDGVFVPGRNRVTEAARQQLTEYFDGARQNFDLPLVPVGTDFQREVWSALTEIPFGATASYAEVASALGRPTAARAVGRANGANALAIVVPCHRVVGADGRLSGYGGGVWRKRRLLDHERLIRSARQGS